MSTPTTTDAVEEKPAPESIPVYDAVPPASTKPKYFVAGNTFYAQTENGELTLPLRFKTGLVRAIRDVEGDEIDQIFALLDGLNDKATADALDELDLFETGALVNAFFQAWREKQQASVGEARRSSN